MARNYQEILDKVNSTDEKLVVKILRFGESYTKYTEKGDVLVRDFKAQVVFPLKSDIVPESGIIRPTIREKKYQRDLIDPGDEVVVFAHDVEGSIYYNYAFYLK